MIGYIFGAVLVAFLFVMMCALVYRHAGDVAAIDLANGRIDAMATEIGRLEGEVAHRDQLIAMREKEIAGQSREIVALQSRVTFLESINAGLKQQTSMLGEQCRDYLAMKEQMDIIALHLRDTCAKQIAAGLHNGRGLGAIVVGYLTGRMPTAEMLALLPEPEPVKVPERLAHLITPGMVLRDAVPQVATSGVMFDGLMAAASKVSDIPGYVPGDGLEALLSEPHDPATCWHCLHGTPPGAPLPDATGDPHA